MLKGEDMSKLFIILPTFNEEKNIRHVLKDWKKEISYLNVEYITQAEIIVVNDGSEDRTGAIVREFNENQGCVTLINHNQNKGLGGAILTGVNYFIENGKEDDLMVVMDADFTHKAYYIHNLLGKKYEKKSDVVIASRFCPDAEVHGVTNFRKMLSYFAKLYNKITFSIPNVNDYTCGYRLYSYRIMEKVYRNYGKDMVSEVGFSCMVEVLYKCYISGAKIAEVPFALYYQDKEGSSKMKIITTIINSLVLPFRIIRKVNLHEVR